MSQKIDPRAVLVHLNELGYTNIDAQQLKEFVVDLKKIIKSDLPVENKENQAPKHVAVHIYNKPVCRHTNLSPSRPSSPNKPSRLSSSSRPSTNKKQFIRPAKPLKANKSDPVSLYHFYQSEWKRIKIPGQDSRDELRWAIRNRMSNGPKVEVKPKTSTTRTAWS